MHRLVNFFCHLLSNLWVIPRRKRCLSAGDYIKQEILVYWRISFAQAASFVAPLWICSTGIEHYILCFVAVAINNIEYLLPFIVASPCLNKIPFLYIAQKVQTAFMQ